MKQPLQYCTPAVQEVRTGPCVFVPLADAPPEDEAPIGRFQVGGWGCNAPQRTVTHWQGPVGTVGATLAGPPGSWRYWPGRGLGQLQRGVALVRAPKFPFQYQSHCPSPTWATVITP